MPVPWWRSPAWLSPLVQLSVAVLVLTLLAWPIAAVVRRRYRVPFPLQGRAAVVHRWMRFAALAVLLVLGGWVWLVKWMSTSVAGLTSKGAPWVWVLHLLSLVAFLGIAAVALWHARVVWAERRRWTSKAWSALLALSGVTLLYVALVFHLVAFNAHF
jgi:hypothetical protein